MYKDYLKLPENELIDYDLIEENNYYVYSELKEKFKNKNEIKIIGKGPTAKYIDDAIGINQSIIFTNKKYMFFSDFAAIFGIEKYYKDIEYIFFPDYPQAGCCMLPEINYITVIRHLKKNGFIGKILIYQTHTTLAKRKIRAFRFKYNNTTIIPIKFFYMFFGIKKFNMYGVQKGEGYHPDLYNLDFSISYNSPEHTKYIKDAERFLKDNLNKSTSVYKKNSFYLDLIKKTYNELISKYGIEIIYN